MSERQRAASSAGEPAANSPRAVICDLGGVLVTSSLGDVVAAWRERSGVGERQLTRAIEQVREADGGRHPLHELETGRITEEELRRRLEAALGDGVRLADLSETYSAEIGPNRAMIGYVRGLRGRGLRTALLTNNVREWEPFWREAVPDVDGIFDVVVDSPSVGMRKPEPEIFHLTLERLGGVRPEDCVLVDDGERNCETARELGMGVVRFAGTEQAIAEIEAALG